jgi:haloacetate dehalogenase
VAIDRRQFIAATAASLGSPLASASGAAQAQPRARAIPSDRGLLPGFDAKWIQTDGAEIFVRHAGQGEPLLLLHGNPLSHISWHKIAPVLARRYHVVATDLRGYGDSVGPAAGGPDHINYSFRVMARDQMQVMTALGHERFFVAGHDRGARAAHRMALDHPARVRKVALLDILPTRHVWGHPSREWALSSWHWSFMAQPDELFERMMAAVPAREYVLRHLGRSGKPAFFDDRALAEYVRCFTPKTIHGSCEDYRAAATIDLVHDEADHVAGRKITMPALVLWGSRGGVGTLYGNTQMDVWREAAADVIGGPIDTGHYLAEEAPQVVIEAFERFFV